MESSQLRLKVKSGLLESEVESSRLISKLSRVNLDRWLS